MRREYDIFISYRRETGEDKARILSLFLSTIGYRVFFDHESGMTGKFETEILAAVEIAPVFLMLLTPHCLDRCIDEDDWVRREIEQATILKKEIIPVNPNYGFEFTNLPDGIPDYVLRLSDLEFAQIDFRKNFKATANSMVDEQIKKFVQPTILLAGSGDKGAKIHFFSDISCRVFHFGNPVAVTDATDTSVGSIVRLLKGRHKLEYKSIEHEDDSYSETYTVPDNDYESFVDIKLQPIKDERKKKEEELRAIEARKAAEEKRRRLRKKTNHKNSNYKYDVYFCYSSKDALIVREAYHFLSSAGYKCFMAPNDIAPGINFSDAIVSAIEESSCFLFFGSESSNSSDFILSEISTAFISGKTIIVLKLDNTPFNDKFRYYLAQYQWIECDLNQREDLVKILNIISDLLDY